MKTVRQVKDLQMQMRSHPDAGMAMQMLTAIKAVIADQRNSINEDSLVTGRTLGEIRVRLYEVGRKPELFTALVSKTGNPTEAALQFIENEMRLVR